MLTIAYHINHQQIGVSQISHNFEQISQILQTHNKIDHNDNGRD